MVFNLALHYVQNHEDAEEISQDVFVSIHQSLPKFKENAAFKTWIYRITINQALDFIKAKKRLKRFAFFTSLFNSFGTEIKHQSHQINHPGFLLEQKQAVQNLFALMNTLPTKQKTALILSKLEGKSQKEIGDIMNISPKAVESLIQRAKTNLLKKMNQNEGK